MLSPRGDHCGKGGKERGSGGGGVAVSGKEGFKYQLQILYYVGHQVPGL